MLIDVWIFIQEARHCPAGLTGRKFDIRHEEVETKPQEGRDWPSIMK